MTFAWINTTSPAVDKDKTIRYMKPNSHGYIKPTSLYVSTRFDGTLGVLCAIMDHEVSPEKDDTFSVGIWRSSPRTLHLMDLIPDEAMPLPVHPYKAGTRSIIVWPIRNEDGSRQQISVVEISLT
jgi:hypothetical protein